MAMTHFLHDTFEPAEFSAHSDRSLTPNSGGSEKGQFHILQDKLCIPEIKDMISRPRLNELLERSALQFGATLISGRSGTGKTALAADYAVGQKKVAWYSVECSDAEWEVFSPYFSAAILSATRKNGRKINKTSDAKKVTQAEIGQFLANTFAHLGKPSKKEPLLIVLDDIHHIFDAYWFGDFFGLLLSSLPPYTHLLLLCRSKPPNPLWRLRSKQLLNVIDEKLIAFNLAETEELFAKHGLSQTTAKKAHSDCFGRISKLLRLAQLSPKS